MIAKTRSVLLLCMFNALTAIAGGLSLMTGLIKPPLKWLSLTPYDSYVVPGLVLLAIVGGSSLFATVALVKKVKWNALYAMLAGWIMWGWIVTEIILIHQFSWLQTLYLGTALAIIWLSIPLTDDTVATSDKNHFQTSKS
ncbi:MAG: hypothetical protein QFB87_01105 [Patescibacteria group bacterium]|nr:hypothetical protein [Patescibacteria group bacterium]